VTHLVCSGDGGPAFLLTDGSILINENGGGYGTRRWWKLTPGLDGAYGSSIWSRVADSNNARKYFASAVLADGRLIVSGGEYSDTSGSQQQDETTATEIFDPAANTWTILAAPPGATAIGDAACCVLPDGRFFVANDSSTWFFTPGVDTWAAGPAMRSSSSEESWVLLGNNTIIAPETNNPPKSEKFDIANNKWVDAASIPDNLVETSSSEIGPGILLPDGRAFFVGANAGDTALYTSPTATTNESWAAGPAIPKRAGDSNSQGAKDGPAALLPCGHVLFAAAPVDGKTKDYLAPSTFFEFDGNALTQVASPPNSDCPTFVGRLLPLPNGEILWSREDDDGVYVYLNPDPPQDKWRPSITACPRVISAGETFTISGHQFNGLSQAQGYGDDYAAATNYPLVRLQDLATASVRFCRTGNHSSMGVATGTTMVVTTNVTVPIDVLPGNYTLVVVANGIASEDFKVSVRRDR
jgi:hypothetical protein